MVDLLGEEVSHDFGLEACDVEAGVVVAGIVARGLGNVGHEVVAGSVDFVNDLGGLLYSEVLLSCDACDACVVVGDEEQVMGFVHRDPILG